MGIYRLKVKGEREREREKEKRASLSSRPSQRIELKQRSI